MSNRGKSADVEFSGKESGRGGGEEEAVMYKQIYGGEEVELAERKVRELIACKGVCGKVLERNGIAWRCPVCARDPDAVICQECYARSNHEGHNEQLVRGLAGGTCDCGDPESWDTAGSCPLHNAGFIDESKITPALLPEPIKSSSVNALDSLVQELNASCLQIEDLIEGKAVKDIETRSKVEIEKRQRRVCAIARVLVHLCKDVSQIFLNMVAGRFREYSLKLSTRHRCHSREFDSEEERTAFEALCGNAGIDPEKCKAGERHPCTCTVIDNFMRIHYAFDLETRAYLNEEFLVTLMRNRRIKFFMAMSYFANAASIFPYDVPNASSLTFISVQIIGYEDTVCAILRSSEFMDNVFGEMKRVFKELSEVIQEKKAPVRDLYTPLLHTCCNLGYLIKEKHTGLFLPQLLRFIKTVALLQGIRMRREEIVANPTQERLCDTLWSMQKSILFYFHNMVAAVDLADQEACRMIFKAFEEAMAQLFVAPGYAVEDHLIILHRCFSFFLENYLITNYWLALPKLKSEDVSDYLKTFVEGISGYEEEKEQREFVHRWLREVLKSIGLGIRLQLSPAGPYENLMGNLKLRARTDYSFAVILLSCLGPTPDLLQTVIKMMHPQENDVHCIVDAFGRQDFTPELWASAAALGSRPKETLVEIVETSMYTLCCWISNDIMHYHPLVILRKSLLFPQDALEQTKCIASDYFEYCISKFIVLMYFSHASKNGITNDTIQNNYPDQTRDINKIEKCLELITNPFIDPAEKVMKFRLQDSSLKLFDPFLGFFKLVRDQGAPDPLAVMKQVQDPETFDYFFGEFAADHEIKPTHSNGLPYIPFKLLLRRNLASKPLMECLEHYLEHSAGESASSWILGCVYKLAIACRSYCHHPSAISTALSKHASRIIPDDEEWSYISLLYDSRLRGHQKSTSTDLDPSLLELKKKESTARRSMIKEIQQKEMEEMKKRMQAFMSKNKTLLSETVTSDPTQGSFVCGYCRGEVSATRAPFERFGKITYICKSSVYGLHLTKLLRELHKNECTKFKTKLGTTHCAVLTSCGHYIHAKCLEQMREKQPTNNVTVIDKIYSPEIFLCPLCQSCANILMPPSEAISAEINSDCLKYIEECVMPKIVQIADPHFQSEGAKLGFLDSFLYLCKYIAYQLHLVDLTNVEDFTLKKDFIVALVGYHRAVVKLDYYSTMSALQSYLGKSLEYLRKAKYQVFETDLVQQYAMILAASAMVDAPEALVYPEVQHKTSEIVKQGIMQILLRFVFRSTGARTSLDQLTKCLESKTFNEALKNLSIINELLSPFLKKLLCVKSVLWPTPKRDCSADLQKAGWLDVKNSLEFYVQALDLREDFASAFFLSLKGAETKSFLQMPVVDQGWMTKAWKSYLRHARKESQMSGTVEMPRMLVVYDAASSPLQLVPLPLEFNTLQKESAMRSCKNCGRTESDSAICLLCGDLLCVARPCCTMKNIGELTTHSWGCPGGCGMYLRLINNNVVLVDGGQVCTCPSPYVNKYGESVDIQKNPGCPNLRLEVRVVEELKTLYLLHRVHSTIRISSVRSVRKFKPFTL